MKSTVYLIMHARGVDRMTKRTPDLYAGEVAIRLTVQVDEEHFRVPYADASIVLGPEHLILPEVEVTVDEPELPHDHEWVTGSLEYEGRICIECGAHESSEGNR